MDKQHGKGVTMTQKKTKGENTARFTQGNIKKRTKLENTGT